ncbi:MAG: helix-turn-helix domain-containing protein [Candidatus Micrarchaeia archaeon]
MPLKIVRVRKVEREDENYLAELLENSKIRQIVFFRWKVVNFYRRRGIKATINVFKVPKATVYRWRNLWKKGNYRLESLIPRNRYKKRKWNNEIVSFILDLRKKNSGIGKQKIKPFCDNFCRERGLKPLSATTIGRILRYLKEKNLTV